MRTIDPELFEYVTNRAYVDQAGDIWVYMHEKWRYINDEGFTTWDARDELPAAHGPYVELSVTASNAVRTVRTI